MELQNLTDVGMAPSQSVLTFRIINVMGDPALSFGAMSLETDGFSNMPAWEIRTGRLLSI